MDFLLRVEQTGIATWVNQSNSIFAYPTVLLLHTIGLTLIVGLNAAIDLRILGIAPQIPLTPMQRLFPLMWVGLAINAATGLLLLMAKATKMFVNPAFYIKMVSIALAVVTLAAIKRALFSDPLLDKRPIPMNGKVLALASLVFWLGAITAGRMIAYVGEAVEYGKLLLN